MEAMGTSQCHLVSLFLKGQAGLALAVSSGVPQEFQLLLFQVVRTGQGQREMQGSADPCPGPIHHVEQC